MTTRKTCQTCNNKMKVRKVHKDYKGPYCRARDTNEEYCEYCEWKGTAGPGKQLKDIISSNKEELWQGKD